MYMYIICSIQYVNYTDLHIYKHTHSHMQALCPCCVPTTEWRVTGQGIRWRKNRATLDCCGDIETQFIDYRFMKDLELRREPKCCCCCVGSELLVYADDKDSVR